MKKVRYQPHPLIYLAKFIVTIPAHMGFTFASASPTAAEKNLGSSNNAFFDRAPVVALSTNADGDLEITVTNLRTGSPDQTIYGISIDGFTNGPSARTCTDATLVTYNGVTENESIDVSDFNFDAVTKTSGVVLLGHPAQNNLASTLVIEFAVDQPIPTGGSLTIGLPF